ncbi:hypothetical protein [Dysgonomonas termitidis]|uniref:Uncharacterized protein n=1 Tax=Dysgonomonas termitidis TaxID=1516126 RepID=A0ABV9KT88_9BACT
MENKDIHIKRLLKKFFDGETTSGEEDELYCYFDQSNIPEEFKKYKPVFSYFCNDISKKLNTDLSGSKDWKQKKSGNKLLLYITGIAATILLLIVVNPLLKNETPYKGSYMVVNGVKTYSIDNPEEIEREILNEIYQREKELDNIELESEK